MLIANPNYDANQMNQLRQCLQEGLTEQQINNLFKNAYDWEHMHHIRMCYKLTSDYDFVLSIVNTFTKKGVTTVSKLLKFGVSKEQICKYVMDMKLKEIQLEQILLGYYDNLTEEQVSIYAKPEFNWSQMHAIRKRLKEGLTVEQAKLFANPEFDEHQIYEIGTGLINGLTIDQVSVYAKPEFDNEQMEQIRLGLEHGLPLECITKFANPDISVKHMFYIRHILQIEKNANVNDIIKYLDETLQQGFLYTEEITNNFLEKFYRQKISSVFSGIIKNNKQTKQIKL